MKRHTSLTGSRGSAQRRVRDERGDVPGWVLVTVMSVALIALITGIAKDELGAILRAALTSVTATG